MSYGKKAQIEMIARDYNWEKIAEQTREVYEKIANKLASEQATKQAVGS